MNLSLRVEPGAREDVDSSVRRDPLERDVHSTKVDAGKLDIRELVGGGTK